MPAPQGGEPAKTVTSSSEDEPAMEASVAKLPLVDAERYQLLGEVARGGVGRILRARDSRLERNVALKQLQDPTRSPARLVREALLTARLQHPAIVPVHEAGRFPSGEAFFAMKLVDGESLRDAIRRRATLGERLELLPNVLAVADAMAYAHSQQVIHRDLKPSNVLLGAFGETVVIDWGLAKDLRSHEAPDQASAPAADGTEATRTGTVMGTPVYMPPEQALGHAADERADVYALGALLYHVIAGAPPFDGGTAAEVLDRVLTTAPAALAERAPGAPGDLCAIVDKAMARDPDERYADARALAEELRRFQLGQIADLRRGQRSYDAELEAEFDAEARARALRPARAIALLALTLVPLFAIVEARLLTGVRLPMLIVRGVAEALIALLLAASYARRCQRWGYEIGLGVIFVVGAMLVLLNRLQGGALAAGFVASLMLVFLGCSTFLHMPSRRVVALLSALTLLHVVLAATSSAIQRAALAQQLALFVTGIVIAGVGVRFSFELQRAEFYSRRRLEQANRRLARLERRSELAVTAP